MKGGEYMTDNNQKGGVNSVAAVITGAVVGAGIAGVVALKDKHNRDKVKEVLENVKDQATEYVENLKKMAEDKKEEVVEKGKKEAKKTISSARHKASKVVKDAKKYKK